MRIGELAARTGVNATTLRAWERRYGLLRPRRTEGGHRLYDETDAARVLAVLRLIDVGMQVSEAVVRLSEPLPDEAVIVTADHAVRSLWDAIDSFEEQAADGAVSAAIATLGIPTALDTVFVPTLRRLGDEWRMSPRNIAREHFASAVIRSHLVRLLPAAQASGPSCLAFCPEGEQHDIGLLMAAVTLATAGRPQVVLGAHTPEASIELLLRELRPSMVLVAATRRRPVLRFLERWRPITGCRAVAGGAGFRLEDEARFGGRVHLGSYADLFGVASS